MKFLRRYLYKQDLRSDATHSGEGALAKHNAPYRWRLCVSPDKIISRSLLLVFIFYTLLGFLMAVGVDAATNDPHSFNTLRLKSGAIQTKPACAGFNTLVRAGGLRLCSREFHSPEILSIQHSPKFLAIQPNTQLQNGQYFYQSGELLKAANAWKNAAAEFQSQGDILNQALVLSYLSLAYQQLGELQLAEATMNQSVVLITNQTLPKYKFILAQILNNQGELQFSQGKSETALETWKLSGSIYRELGDDIGKIGSEINQSRALQAMGFYRGASTTLAKVKESLKSQPDSEVKVAVLLNLGNILRIIGDFTNSQKTLDEGLEVAQRLQSISDIQIAWLSLGNLSEAREKPQEALKYYQEAAAENSQIKLSAQIHQLALLIKLNRLPDAQKIVSSLQTKLTNLPPSQTTIYAQIELAENLVKLNPQEVTAAARLLATAQNQAKLLGNPRAESYAWGRLGQLYEQTQQWEDAKQLTQKALSLTQTIRAPEIAYQWQWQMGRLLVATGEQKDAVAAYTEAVNTLQSVRQDLVDINQDVQFSFREEVEPVYRELVDLLLQPTQEGVGKVSQNNLQEARKTIESLQLAELANFFREACLDSQPQEIDRIDPTAAVIYPIILPDRLEAILALPGQPLVNYSTNLTNTQVENAIARMRQSLRQTSFTQERLAIAQEIYNWLIQPVATDLKRQSIKTLVFVLDGSLRNIPMAALSDGQEYLIEQYQIAIAPSLELLKSQTLAHTRLKTLVAGISEGKEEFSPLPGVKEEIKDISVTVPTITLLDRQFTTQALENQVKQEPFSIVHLATHGQFSSKPEDTFILTWDGRLDVKELNTLLVNRESSQSPPIELLILSACQTAKGDKRAALGLAGVAVKSGARSTLATLWTVNDESTAKFMQYFYQQLLNSEGSKAQAVRLAQLNLLKQPEYSHPYYWAPFILVGNWL